MEHCVESAAENGDMRRAQERPECSPMPSHEACIHSVLVHWNRLVKVIQTHRNELQEEMRRRADSEELHLTPRDWEYIAPTVGQRESPIVSSQIVLERLLVKESHETSAQKSALQVFLQSISAVGGKPGQDVVVSIATLAADEIALQKQYDALRGFTFETLSEQDLSEMPDMAHLQIAPMSKSSVKFRSRIQELFRNGRFGVDGACSSDYALLPPESVADGNAYIPVSMTILEGRQAADYVGYHGVAQTEETKLQQCPENTVDLQHVLSGGRGRPEKLRCLLLGPPGAGKTMTALEALRQWAKCRMFTECKLAFYIPARALSEETKDVWELLQLNTPCYGLDESEMADVRQFVQENSKQVLLVVDGLDEVPEQMITEKSVLSKLLSGDPFSTYHLIATSRPCKQAHTLMRVVDYKYQFHDLTEDQQLTMLQSRLSPVECKEFKKELDSKPLIKPLMGNPLQASLIIGMFKACPGQAHRLPSGLCDVYGDVVTRALQRYVTRTMKIKDSILSDPVEQVVQHQTVDELHMPGIVKALGEVEKLALKGLLEQQYLFSVPSVAEEALESGLLVHWNVAEDYKPARLGRSCQFIHIAIQEFLAARCITSSHNLQDAIDGAMEKVGLDVRRYNFWLCLSGMLDKFHLTHFLVRIGRAARRGTFEEQKMAMKLLLHSLAQVLVQKDSKTLSCWRTRSASATGSSCFELKFADVLPNKTLDCSHHQLDDVDFNVLCSLLSADNTLRVLNLESCRLEDWRCAQLAACRGMKKIETYHIGVNRNIGGPCLSKALQPFRLALSHLKILSIRNTSLPEGEFVSTVSDFLKTTRTLRQIYLERTSPLLTSDGCRDLAEGLKENKSLTHLSCSGMRINDEGVAVLAEAVLVQGKIKHLQFYGNNITNAGGKACLTVAVGLKCRHLNLSFNNLTGDVLPELKDTLRALQEDSGEDSDVQAKQSPIKLSLAGNHFERSEAEDLSSAVFAAAVTVDFGLMSVSKAGIKVLSPERIGETRMLYHGNYTQLDLSFLGMGDAYVEHIEAYLSELDSVHSLSMGHNKLSSAGMIPLSSALKTNTCIQAVDLSYNNIGLEGLETILDAIDEDGDNSTLRYLSIGGNALVDEGMSEDDWYRLEVALGRLVSECPNLQLIGLASTGLGDRGAEMVAEYIPERSSLIWLALGVNNITAKGVEALSKTVAKNSSMRILSLSCNALNDHAITLLNQMQEERVSHGCPALDTITVDTNKFTDQVKLGPGLLNGRLYFSYSTQILSLLDDYSTASGE